MEESGSRRPFDRSWADPSFDQGGKDGETTELLEGYSESRSEQGLTVAQKGGKVLRQVEKSSNAIVKFNRLGTHLSNERTFLAWVRTACSMFAIAIAMLKFEAIQDFLIGTLLLVCSVLTFIIGAVRYFQVKNVLENPTPEVSAFNRIGIRYYMVAVGAAFTGIFIERLYNAYQMYE